MAKRARRLRSGFPAAAASSRGGLIEFRKLITGDTPCGCGQCVALGTAWPRHYCGHNSRRRRPWVSYECWLEKAQPASDELVLDERSARRQGLTIKRRRRPRPAAPAVLLSGQCELCGGLKPAGRRYCLHCESIVKRQMSEAGYLAAA